MFSIKELNKEIGHSLVGKAFKLGKQKVYSKTTVFKNIPKRYE